MARRNLFVSVKERRVSAHRELMLPVLVCPLIPPCKLGGSGQLIGYHNRSKSYPWLVIVIL